MAWNRPSAAPKPQPKKPTALRGLLAFVILLVLAGVAAWFIFSGDKGTVEVKESKRGMIREVNPALPKKSPEQLEKEAHAGMVKVRGKWYPEYNKKGGRIWISKNWVKYHSPVVYTNRTNSALVPKEVKLFTNKAEQEIAAQLCTPLGSTIIGEIRYGEPFVRQFLESIKTPIIVTKDDEPWEAEMKRAVIDAKIELKARYDAGEDIAKLMTDNWKQMQDLGVYRQQLDYELRKQVLEAAGDAETTKTLFDAANIMLAERGLKPLKMPVMLRKKLELNLNKKGE